ncbi:MAG: hypothetical protein LUG57_10470 [Oscillospiraceae bacterium]|nr:hypothetical protein [Oscillospiraceae bacterium]
MTSVTVSAIALLISLVLFIVLSMKGFPQIPIILLCVAIVALTIEGTWISNFVDVFSEGTASTFQNSVLVYLTGGALGGVIAATGCAKSLGRFIIRYAGKKSGPILCMLLNVFIGFSGMATSVFVVISVCSAIAEEADQPLYIYLAATTGIGAVVQFSCPGFPGFTNLMPTFYLGTTIYAGAALGIVGVIVGSALVIAYTFYLIKQAEKKEITLFPLHSVTMPLLMPKIVSFLLSGSHLLRF